MEEETVRLFRH